MLIRRLLRIVALVVGLTPVALALFLWAPWSSTTSLVVVAPGGGWVAPVLVLFLGPVVLGVGLWLLAGLIKSSR